MGANKRGSCGDAALVTGASFTAPDQQYGKDEMRLFGKHLDHEVAVSAEIGGNHEGSLDKAIALMRLTHRAGADAAKFQTFTPGRRVTRPGNDSDYAEAVIPFFKTLDWLE